MDQRRLDCDHCQSAASVQNGTCQICLAEHPTAAVRIGTGLARRIVLGSRFKPRERLVLTGRR